jgi:hypothetical protein
MLPVSITMFITSALGSRLSRRMSIRSIVRTGFATIVVAIIAFMSTIEPTLASARFAFAMGLLGIGMGLLASQLGNVVQSSVDASGRGEAGGLQFTGQQLGSSIGVALIGAIVLTGLTSAFVTQVQGDDRISDEVAGQVSVAVGFGIDFVSSDLIETATLDAGLDPETSAAVVDAYERAQLQALEAGALAAAVLALASLAFTGDLPSEGPTHRDGGRHRRDDDARSAAS